MSSTKFKIESGMQLLARLIKKRDILNFYPLLFQSGPKSGDVIEISSENSTPLLVELISEALIPSKFGGVEAGVLIFNTDGNLNFNDLLMVLKKKILRFNSIKTENIEIDNFLHETLRNFYMINVYDADQLYTTILNLDNLLIEYSNISLVVFDTLTAFYWSEQGFQITKMDLYVKNLLRIIQRVSKEYKITCLYTKPEYFSSIKDLNNTVTDDQLNYRIRILDSFNGNYQVNVKAIDNQFSKSFCVQDGDLKWL